MRSSSPRSRLLIEKKACANFDGILAALIAALVVIYLARLNQQRSKVSNQRVGRLFAFFFIY